MYSYEPVNMYVIYVYRGLASLNIIIFNICVKHNKIYVNRGLALLTQHTLC
jgi:hypothetical protein